MTGARVLAAWVAAGDGTLSLDESVTLDEILAEPEPTYSNLRIADADLDEALRGTYYQGMATLVRMVAGGAAADNILCRAIELLCQTVIAADGSREPEFAQLGEVMDVLWQAAATATAAAGQGAAAVPAPATSPSAPPPEPDTVAGLLAELDALVGLASVKREVRMLTNLARVFALRREMGLPVPPMSFHFLFLGNPGTGKTIVARIIARLYGQLRLLSHGQLVEVGRAGLVANYVGQTATKVEGVLARAADGMLSIDEAYALAGNESDYRAEAVATLLKGMEDRRHDLVVIAAGYPQEMHPFLAMDPGLRSRLARELTFEDDSPEEMVRIFGTMATAAGYTLAADADAALLAVLQQRWEGRGQDSVTRATCATCSSGWSARKQTACAAWATRAAPTCS